MSIEEATKNLQSNNQSRLDRRLLLPSVRAEEDRSKQTDSQLLFRSINELTVVVSDKNDMIIDQLVELNSNIKKVGLGGGSKENILQTLLATPGRAVKKVTDTGRSALRAGTDLLMSPLNLVRGAAASVGRGITAIPRGIGNAVGNLFQNKSLTAIADINREILEETKLIKQSNENIAESVSDMARLMELEYKIKRRGRLDALEAERDARTGRGLVGGSALAGSGRDGDGVGDGQDGKKGGGIFKKIFDSLTGTLKSLIGLLAAGATAGLGLGIGAKAAKSITGSKTNTKSAGTAPGSKEIKSKSTPGKVPGSQALDVKPAAKAPGIESKIRGTFNVTPESKVTTGNAPKIVTPEVKVTSAPKISAPGVNINNVTNTNRNRLPTAANAPKIESKTPPKSNIRIQPEVKPSIQIETKIANPNASANRSKLPNFSDMFRSKSVVRGSSLNVKPPNMVAPKPFIPPEFEVKKITGTGIDDLKPPSSSLNVEGKSGKLPDVDFKPANNVRTSTNIKSVDNNVKTSTNVKTVEINKKPTGILTEDAKNAAKITANKIVEPIKKVFQSPAVSGTLKFLGAAGTVISGGQGLLDQERKDAGMSAGKRIESGIAEGFLELGDLIINSPLYIADKIAEKGFGGNVDFRFPDMSETYRYYDIRGEKNMQTVARGKARDKALAETYFSEREANEAAKAVNINDYIIKPTFTQGEPTTYKIVEVDQKVRKMLDINVSPESSPLSRPAPSFNRIFNARDRAEELTKRSGTEFGVEKVLNPQPFDDSVIGFEVKRKESILPALDAGMGSQGVNMTVAPISDNRTSSVVNNNSTVLNKVPLSSVDISNKVVPL